jgi:PKD repeat protein/FtsP/CotA-like multicopper oxidase with cupredoxin domain
MYPDHRLTKKLLFVGLLVMLLLLSASVAGAGTAVSKASQIDAANVSVNTSGGITGVPTSAIAAIGTFAKYPIIKGQAVTLPTPNPEMQQALKDHKVMLMHNVTTAQRFAAAENTAAQGTGAGNGAKGAPTASPVPNLVKTPALAPLAQVPVIGGTPDYFGPYSNYANSQLPVDDGTGNAVPGTGIRKFVDSLPGLTPAGANNLGQYIPVATTDVLSYPGDDYYVIAVVQYTEKMHSDIDPTVLRGYVQLMTPNITSATQFPLTYPNGTAIRDAQGAQVIAVDKPHYLGPAIVAQKDKVVRVKFHNYLPTGTDGNLFIPVDTTMMGAGVGPDGVSMYKENRATIHLHGGTTPWISDGTPHQWTTPANENTPYPEGVSVKNVPDMDNGNEPVGTLTFYYTNQQSARLVFYHDHAYGITRLNVYAGEAAGYIIRDSAEQGLITSGTIPSGANEVPLVIEDKSFVPDAAQITATDPTWNWGNPNTAWPHTGDLWYPHVYMPIQKGNFDVNPMGRWDYGPWFTPPFLQAKFQPVANPYYDPINAPWEPQFMPATPNPSGTPEAFMDTPTVNGAVYPYVQVGPHAYRFRVLNACNDRTLNLQFYYAASNDTMWNGQNLLNGSSGEVPMVPATPILGFPASWPTDGRDGGVPDPAAAGPDWIQIGTEGGLLPAPVVIHPQPVNYDYAHTAGGILNMLNYSLLLMPAQRADVIVDFSGIPDGTKLILYNDAPAPSPGGDSRYDYYTGDPNQTLIGGAPTTLPGYGPNTRTIMQIQVNSALGSAGPFDLNALNSALPGAYATYQDKPIVPEPAYNTAFGASYPTNYVNNLLDTSISFVPADQTTSATIGLQAKAIIGDFEINYGRLTALLGTSFPGKGQASGYIDPPTEVLNNSVKATLIGSLGDGTQIWRIVNYDVDLHPVHWHMVNLQVINRVRWDGVVIPPDPDELGWRETIDTPPLMDTIVALRPITPDLPWELPNSIRLLDVTQKPGATDRFTGLDPSGGQAPVTNHLVNFGWEYVWHCHILGHEENDFMHPMSVAVAPKIPPSDLSADMKGSEKSPNVVLKWTDRSVSETNWTVQRANSAAGPWSQIALTPSFSGPQTGGFATFTDANVVPKTPYFYRVLATNIVGDTTVYPNTGGYPTITVSSSPSDIASPEAGPKKPVAKFTGMPTSGAAPLTVKFTDASTNTPTTWKWSFGDGGTSVDQNPSHTYANAGKYTVKLTATNSAGSDTIVKDNYITVSRPAAPVAKFTGMPTSGAAPLTVKFTDASTNTPTTWKWSFGDGGTSVDQNPSHTYANAGKYTVKLTVSNSAGSNSLTKNNYITVTQPVAVKANFVADKNIGRKPMTVNFIDLSRGSPTTWLWNFGDGSTSPLPSPSHTYTVRGLYTVSLKVQNSFSNDQLTRRNYILVI